MKSKITFFVTLMMTLNCMSQSPDIEWQHYYAGNSLDAVLDQKQTADGGYIMVGTTNSTNIPSYHFNSDILLIKVNDLGILQWQKAIGGNGNDSSSSIQILSNGDYLLCGSTTSSDNDFDFNRGESDVFLMRLNPTGTVLWQKTYGGTDFDNGSKALQTADGGFIIGGYSSSVNGDITLNNGDQDFWLVKVNNMGVLQWQKNYGGSNWDSMASLVITSDGGYIMAGDTSSNIPGYHSGTDVFVVKTDSLGTVVWQKCYGGSNWEYGNSIIPTSDGNFLIGASTRSTNFDVTSNHGGFFDFWIVKINPAGTILWQKTYGGSNGEQLTKLIQTNDGNYVACGISNSTNGDLTANYGSNDFWIIKVDTIGNLMWQKSLGVAFDETANALIQTPDNGYLVTGNTYPASISSDVWAVKLFYDNLVTNEVSVDNKKILVYPNPVTDYFMIAGDKVSKVSVADLSGKIVKEFTTEHKYDIRELSKGNYFLEILNDSNQSKAFKIIKE